MWLFNVSGIDAKPLYDARERLDDLQFCSICMPEWSSSRNIRSEREDRVLERVSGLESPLAVSARRKCTVNARYNRTRR